MRSKFTTVFTVIGVATVLILAGNTISEAATGHGFLLGKSNSANKITTLSRTTSGSVLSLHSKSSANPPFSVNGKGKVANLNADALDGLAASTLRTHNYAFESAFSGKHTVQFTIPVPNGGYLITYSTIFSNVGVAGIQCFVEQNGPGNNDLYVGYSSLDSTTNAWDPALTGTALVSKTATTSIQVECDAGGSATFSTGTDTPMQIVATPTTLISTHSLNPN